MAARGFTRVDRPPGAARYAQGGLAYLAGDLAVASSVLRELLTDDAFLMAWGPAALTLLRRLPRPSQPLAPWQLALGYGDPQRAAGEEIDRLLRQSPGDGALLFGRGLVHRLDGEHRSVIATRQSIYPKVAAGRDRELSSLSAQVIADAHAALGQGDQAFDWYRQALEAGGIHGGAVTLKAFELACELRRGLERRQGRLREASAPNRR